MEFRSVREQVTDRLREEILLGNYATGDALKEIPLSQKYEVSRGPIRDAFIQLCNEGLLSAIPNRGVRVGEPWDKTLLPTMAKIRFELESHAIEALCNSDDLSDFSQTIKNNLRMMKMACEDEDISSVVRYDLQFHRLILKECGKPGLEAVWLPLLGKFRLPYSRHSHLLESYEEHKSISDAILSQDSQKAIEYLKLNILKPFKNS